MTIRPLTINDVLAYRDLRLKALQTNPASYLATLKTEQTKPLESFAWEIRSAVSPPVSGYYGLYLDQILIGYAQLDQVSLPKQRHIAYLYNLYVDPAHRGQGLATKLVNHLTKLAKEQQIERLFISCNRQNTPAQKFYQHLGFKQFGLKEKSVKWQGEYDDEVEMVKEL
jgi:ribosomal protein S18 acetylase RimI-like enzyme